MGEKKYKDIELRSEEVQEVMSHISPWVVRWGLTALFMILLAILVGCRIFKYPDTLVAEITLATEDPPASVLAHATGKLDKLYVKNGRGLIMLGRMGWKSLQVSDCNWESYNLLLQCLSLHFLNMRVS